MDISGIRILGKGNIGAKMRQLTEKAPALRNMGWHLPDSTIFAEDSFDTFFQRNDIGKTLREIKPSPEIEQKIMAGAILESTIDIFKSISVELGNRPGIARSSAEGDARGTGVYESEFFGNTIAEMGKAFKRVLASYFTKSAELFRKDAQTGEGFGISIEPVVGQWIGQSYAPILSGYGYTSTSRGEGYINVVPGLLGGVESRFGEQITRKQIKAFKNLEQYLSRFWLSMYNIEKRSALRRNLYEDLGKILGGVFSNDCLSQEYLNDFFDDSHSLTQIDLNELFSKMEQMEGEFKKRR